MINGTGYRATQQIAQQQKLSQQIARVQSDISSGKRILVASDDPVAAARVAQIRQAQADQAAWTRNVNTAQSLASQVDTSLTGIAAVFNRVKELTLAGASESVSSNDRQAMVQELNSLNTTLNNYAAAATPTGQNLFPTDAPVLVSVSDTLHLPATAQRSDVFDGIPLSHGGMGTLSSIITAAAAAIATDDVATRRAAADISLADVSSAVSHVSAQQSAQGLRAAQLDAAETTLVNNGTDLAGERSSLEDTDVASAVLRLNAKTLSLQAAQASFARVNRNTLFDFLS
jgi:flagellar hook-associated protein 3 FlgL